MVNKIIFFVLLFLPYFEAQSIYAQKYGTYFYNKQKLDTVIRNIYDFDSLSFFDELKIEYKKKAVKKDIEALIKINKFISNKDYNLSVKSIAKKYKTSVELQDSGWLSFFLYGGYLRYQVSFKLHQTLFVDYSYSRITSPSISQLTGYINYSYPYFFILPYIDYPISFMGHLLFTNQVKI